MPIYEYRCNSCGHELEKLQRISEEPLRDCPACSEASLCRLISPAGFRLKGSGWYETDFKRDNKRNVVEKTGEAEGKKEKTDAAATTSESKGADKSTSESKTETKSETKSDGKGAKATAA